METGSKSECSSLPKSALEMAWDGKGITICNVQEVEILIYWCCAHLGMSEQDEMQIETSRDYLHDHLNKYTKEEVNYAFSAFTKGDTDLKRISTKVMSPMLLGKIMRAYDQLKHREVMRLKTIEVDQPKARPVYTIEHFKNAYDNLTEHIMEHNEIPRGVLWLFVYEHFKLKEMGWYSESQEVRRKLKREFMVKIDNQINREIHAGTSASMEIAKGLLSNKNARRLHYRSKYMQEYFQNMITKNDQE